MEKLFSSFSFHEAKMVILKLIKYQNHWTISAVQSFPMSLYYTEPVHDIVVQHSRLVEGFSWGGVSMSPLSNEKKARRIVCLYAHCFFDWEKLFSSLLPWGENGHCKTNQVSESLNYFGSASISYVPLLYGTCTWYSGTALETSREGFSRSGVSMSLLSNRKRPVESFFSTLTAFSMGGNFFHLGCP